MQSRATNARKELRTNELQLQRRMMSYLDPDELRTKKTILASDAKEEGVGNPLKKRPDTRIKSVLLQNLPKNICVPTQASGTSTVGMSNQPRMHDVTQINSSECNVAVWPCLSTPDCDFFSSVCLPTPAQLKGSRLRSKRNAAGAQVVPPPRARIRESSQPISA